MAHPRNSLLGLFMRRVLAARIAELRKLQATSRRPLVLGCRIVPVLAIGALKRNDLAHNVVLLSWPATSAGKQLASYHRHAATQA